jgi:hypothetical protein
MPNRFVKALSVFGHRSMNRTDARVFDFFGSLGAAGNQPGSSEVMTPLSFAAWYDSFKLRHRLGPNTTP